MGNRYKRMVTLGMISFTALLAWGYCMLAYRSQAVYVAIISLVLVGSIYALLLSFVDIKVAKEQAMQEYVTKTLQEYTKKRGYGDPQRYGTSGKGFLCAAEKDKHLSVCAGRAVG